MRVHGAWVVLVFLGHRTAFPPRSLRGVGPTAPPQPRQKTVNPTTSPMHSMHFNASSSGLFWWQTLQKLMCVVFSLSFCSTLTNSFSGPFLPPASPYQPGPGLVAKEMILLAPFGPESMASAETDLSICQAWLDQRRSTREPQALHHIVFT